VPPAGLVALGNQVLQGRVNPTVIRLQRIAASTALVAYFGWNGFWLAQRKVPPSLWTAITGLPCPTTGGCRSVVALAQADFFGFLYWNPMTGPIVAMLVATLCLVARDVVRRRPPAFGHCFACGWVSILGVAWAFKLVDFFCR